MWKLWRFRFVILFSMCWLLTHRVFKEKHCANYGHLKVTSLQCEKNNNVIFFIKMHVLRKMIYNPFFNRFYPSVGYLMAMSTYARKCIDVIFGDLPFQCSHIYFNLLRSSLFYKPLKFIQSIWKCSNFQNHLDYVFWWFACNAFAF